MRIISAEVHNFASYKELRFNFENQGLTLIQGPTGSGKSTLCDITSWILFGKTAKDGSVDEVRSWDTEDATDGTLVFQYGSHTYYVRRIRGKKSNDLFYGFHTDYMTEGKRGKDLNDTQKLINNLIGIDSALYLSGAYFHEFSQTAQFFTTTAKNRRVICEQLVDLSLAVKLQASLVADRKEATECHNDNKRIIAKYMDRIQQFDRNNHYEAKSKSFDEDKAARILSINTQIKELSAQLKTGSYFEKELKKISQARFGLGSDKCSECGAKKHSDSHTLLSLAERDLQQEIRNNDVLNNRINDLEDSLVKEKARENTYGQLLAQNKKELKEAKNQLKIAQSLQENAEATMADIELLLEVVNDFRALSIKNTIQNLEDNTNNLLSKHFDAEIRVCYSPQEADKIDVEIFKDGNLCSFTQLSKGQRQLLKLCFGISVMRSVANHHGIEFNAIFLDECADGMDDAFKARTFGLLQELALEYESIFLVEHSEAIKAMFTNKYSVSLVDGSSQIEKN